MIDMLRRHEVQLLRAAGHTQGEVAARAGVSLRSVKRIEREPAVASADTLAAREARGIGRPSKAEPFRKRVEGWLREEPHLRSVELLRRAKIAGYEGSKSALYELVRAIRVEPVRATMRFEGLPGEFTQHDFGQVDVTFTDGRVERVQFFASRLKYSRAVQVSITPDQTAESLVRALVGHFQAFGGIPLLAVFDRPKTVAVRWKDDGTVTEWNATFSGVAMDLGLGIEVCWPYQPQQKGAVENLVGWVKGSFFKQRRFENADDLARQLAEWLVEVNERRPSRATNAIPSVRLLEERARLRPLKIAPDALALRIPVVVGPTGMVTWDSNRYSMPPDAIGIAGTLFLYRDRVRIVVGRFEAEHLRLFGRNEITTLPAHRALAVAATSGRRGQRYLMREHLLELGQPAFDYLTELVHRRPRLWLDDVVRLHALLQRHGPRAVREAFVVAHEKQLFGAEYVEQLVRPPLLAGVA